jgi:hypothetical protein
VQWLVVPFGSFSRLIEVHVYAVYVLAGLLFGHGTGRVDCVDYCNRCRLVLQAELKWSSLDHAAIERWYLIALT